MAGGDHLDEVLAEVGYGRWQVPIVVFSLAIHAMIPVHQLGSTLLSSPADFRCSRPHAAPAHAGNASEGSGYQTDLPAFDLPEFPSLCLDPSNFSAALQPANSTVNKVSLTRLSTGIPSCPEVEYDTSVFSSTIVTEWHLICERTSWRTLFPMMYPIGSLLGSAVGGYFSDRIGRKLTSRIGILLTLPTCLGITVVPWFSAMLAMKALAAFSAILVFYPAYSLAAETSPPRHRGSTLMLLALAFFVVMTGFGALGYLVKAWRVLWLLCNVPLLLAVPVVMLIDESPRWLIQKGLGAEAAAVLEKAARQNGVQFSSGITSYLEKLKLMNAGSGATGGGGERQCSWVEGVMSYLRSPAMRTVLLVTPVLWLFQRMVYVGIVLSANNFTSNSPFEYVIISGGIGGIAVLLATPVMAKLGRKTIIGGALLASTVMLLGDMVVPAEHWWLKWILVLGAFSLSVGAFQVNYVFTAELVPTVIRTRGFTLCNLVGCIGEAIVPVVTEVATRYAWWASSVSFGAAGLAASLLVILLPETKGRPLPENIADVEDRHNSLKNRDTKPQTEGV
ncbi:organic cation transporter protein-like [Penaeus japonicus]|uniref:organic cation transporter protein-like n=1 Tax=Penaeus japonicus TaxID=27405 RepID=UPI001C70D8BD|nr:organic cation transporter protein-like [Penaeus japonicus]